MTEDTYISEDYPNIPADAEINHIIQARLTKLERLKGAGVDPYPHSSRRSNSVPELLAGFEEFQAAGATLTLAGRIMSLRLMGKAAFCHIQDEGERVQLYIKRDEIGDAVWERFNLLDIGDIIEAEGVPFVTRTGEGSLRCRNVTLLAKNIRPLPAVKEKGEQRWYEWSDKEERYRRRHLDLILNRTSRELFLKRSRIVAEMRAALAEMGFIEVETPILQPLYGGAAAEPFTTRYHALDREFYLRIADELYLKRLIAGGFNRVFEIGKDFRNEGIDRMHSPEFTMMECYAAYQDYNFCMDLIEKLMPRLAAASTGSPIVDFRGERIDFTTPYPRKQMREIILERTGVDIMDRVNLAERIRGAGVDVNPAWGIGKMIDELFSERVQPTLVQPSFVLDYPVELSPLAKRHRQDERLVERFEFFAAGMELGNAFTELNDPLDQRARFEEQARLRAAGDAEAHPVDEDFISALEAGMPPTAGLGMGVDRLVMVLTGAWSLREVILFPALKTR